MKRTSFRLRLCVCLLVLNLTFIWGNSMLPADASTVFSDWVRDVLVMLFSGGGGAVGGGTGLLRKIAHFSEFACLGVLLAWLMGMLGKRRALALGAGFAAACIDESIQFFSPGRSPGVLDVIIDTSGVLTGICLMMVLIHILQQKMRRRAPRNI